MRRIFVWLLIVATMGFISACDSVNYPAKSVSLVSIEVTPANSSIASGTSHQFTAIGIYDDNTKQDITRLVAWNSSSPGVVSISSDAGLATSLMPGNSTITATLGGNVGTASLTVTSAVLISIEVTPSVHRMALRSTQQFTATGIYSDQTRPNITKSVTWSSSRTDIATVSNDGKVESIGTATGASTITATLGSVSGMTELSVTSASLVSIEVTAIESPNAALGTSVQLIATGTYSDGTPRDVSTAVAWVSSSKSKATVDNFGLVKSLDIGETIITATLENISGQITLNITPATLKSIQITLESDLTSPIIARGTNAQLTATGSYSDGTTQKITSSVIWNSGNVGVATVSNANNDAGLVTSVDIGQTVITARSGGVSGQFTLEVTSATLVGLEVTAFEPNISLGTTAQFTATGIFSDYSKQNLTKAVLWSSSNTGVATISNAENTHGLTVPVSVGNITITAVYAGASGTVTSGSATLTITNATLLSIAIVPGNSSIAQGTTAQLTATGTFSNNTSQNLTKLVTWSSDSGRVMVSNAVNSQGVILPSAPGNTAIEATYNGIVGATSLIITNATLVSIAVAPSNRSIAFGTSAYFTATGAFSDHTTQNITKSVTWSSTNSTVATISNANNSRGVTIPLAMGTTEITATLGTVVGTENLTVTNATLLSIAVTPINPSLALGMARQLTATGTFSDNTTQNITQLVTWSSSNPSAATVSNAANFHGRASSVGVGSSDITASLWGIQGATTLTVP